MHIVNTKTATIIISFDEVQIWLDCSIPEENKGIWNQYVLFFNPHPRICLLILERQGERETEGDGGGGEKHEWEGETSIGCFPCVPQQGMELVPCMCPDRGSNPQPFGVRDNGPTNWATWPGLKSICSCVFNQYVQYVKEQKAENSQDTCGQSKIAELATLDFNTCY